ncbi:MAG: VWA domain-containing protein [Nitrospinae bacterium]|nr:VWA domain-containing protein [Nitrospinota bacterium]
MRFAAPLWLYAPLALPLLWLLARYAATRFRRAPLVAPSSRAKLAPRWLERADVIRSGFLLIAAALIMLSLSRPQYGVKPTVIRGSGADIVIALDTSKSMAARDARPNRMAQAKREITLLTRALEGHRVGIITFAGRAFLECPLTLDAAAARMILDNVEVDAIPVPGTDLTRAVEEATRAFFGSQAKTKALILVTDGEDLAGGGLEQAARAARDAGVTVFPVGVGSAGGAPVPLLDGKGTVTGYRNGPGGQPVVSRLDEGALSRLAELTGGRAYLMRDGSLALDDLAEELNRREKSDIASFEYTEYEERYQPLAAMAMAMLLGEYALFVWLSRPREISPPPAG